jgi:lysozyme
MNRELMIGELLTDESNRLLVYDDKTGKTLKPGMTLEGHPTIGRGRALDVNGISHAESLYLCNNDIDRCQYELNQAFPWFLTLDDVRQRAWVNMCFTMGIDRVKGFRDAVRCMSLGAFESAAAAVLDSDWAREQAPARASRVAAMIRTGAI